MQSLDSAANTWNTAKKFMGWGCNSGPPDQLNINGCLVTKAFDIACEMNSFFAEKVRLIQESISFIPNSFQECHNIMDNKFCKLDLSHVTIQQVNKMLKQLKNGKCCSIDSLDR